MGDLSDSPIFQKYRPYQIGFIQDRHNALGSELDLLIQFFNVKSVTTKESFAKRAKGLFDERIISKEMHDDLQLINNARNKFVKSLDSSNDKDIRNLLNNVKSLWWKTTKRNKYDVYRLLVICIQSIHISLGNSPSYKKYLRTLGIKI